MRKRETKFKSVFQSNAKKKNEIHIRFSKWCEKEKRKLKLISVFQRVFFAKAKNEIRSSKPFFKVRRKRKTKSKIQICFSMSCENEKWIWHLNSFFPCHRKTVGTKVHALCLILPFLATKIENWDCKFLIFNFWGIKHWKFWFSIFNIEWKSNGRKQHGPATSHNV